MKSKIFGLIFSGLFAVAFTAGGIFAGVIPLWDAVRAKVGEYSRVAVDAKVVEVSLERGSKRTTGVRVTYAYTWQGARYASDRISVQHNPRSRDNLSDWHDRWYRTLSGVKQRDGTITAWVDPESPADAVLDRDIRWAKVWFAIPFAFLFTGVGLAATWVFFKLLFSDTSEFVSDVGNRVAPEANPAQLKPASSIGIAVFGVVWSLLAVPMCVIAWTQQTDTLARAITTLFSVVGVWMIGSGIASHLRARRTDALTLALSPPQPTFGEPFRVTVRVRRRGDAVPPPAIAVSLEEKITDERGSSTSSRTGASETYIALRTRSDAFETQYEATIDAPAQGHASGGIRGDLVYSWTISVAESGSARGMSFPITLAPAQANETQFQKRFAGEADDFATAYRKLAQTTPNALVTFVPERVCRITQQGSEWTASFPARGLGGGSVFTLLLALGALAWAFGTLLYAPRSLSGTYTWIWIALFAAISLIGLVLHFSTRCFQVTISRAGLLARIESALSAREIKVPLARLSRFATKAAYSRASVDGNEAFSSIQAFEITADRRHKITPNLSERGALQALEIEMNDALERVRHFGITPAPEGPVAPLMSPLRRWASRVIFVLFGLGLVSLAYVLLYERGRVWPVLDKLSAYPYALPETPVSFTPASDPQRDQLMNAIDANDLPAMTRLLDAGADVNTESVEGSTLLHIAATRGMIDMATLLIDRGADINRVTQRGEQFGATALSSAIYCSQPEMARLLIARGAKTTGLNYYGWGYANTAAYVGCIECLKALKDAGVNLDQNAPGGRQETPIMTAARNEQLDTIRFLAREGASLSKRDPYGYNVMGWAHFFKKDAAKALLLELGADPDVGEKRGA